MNLIFCEADRDPRSAMGGRFLAEERLAHVDGSGTLMKHYCTNKPSHSVAPLSFFEILRNSDRTILGDHTFLDGLNAWDAFLLKTWFNLIMPKLTVPEQHELKAFLIQAKANLLRISGWEPGYSEKFALANRVVDIFEVAIKANAEAIHNHLRTHQEQDDFLKRLRMEIDPQNVGAMSLIDTQIANATKSAELTGVTATETKTMRVEWAKILSGLELADQAVEHLPGDHITMIDRYSQALLTEKTSTDTSENSLEQNKNSENGRKAG